MIGPIEVLRSFAATLWRSRKGQSRAKFQAWQTRAVTKWLRTSLPKVAFYDHTARNLTDLSVIDKALLMSQFDQFNRHALNVDDAWAIQQAGGLRGGLTVGASTGTSGNRGLFVISEAEKLRWLGAIVAKTMADLIWKPQRVAIILPQDTGLYSSANRLRFIQLRTFSSLIPPDQWRAEFEAFNPTIIVAPPKMLRHFAENDYALEPTRVFSAAETLDPVDEHIVNAYFDQNIRQIYMATEGLFAVSCAHGSLHLAEDSIAFEFEDVGGGLVSPLVTSFRRDTQIMARYRMKDLLRLSPTPCPCGSPLQVVTEVVGRMDDTFVFGDVLITPDVLRNAILDADRSITDFRLLQVSTARIRLLLPPEVSAIACERANLALTALLVTFGANATIDVQHVKLPLETQNKLRRVQRQVPFDA